MRIRFSRAYTLEYMLLICYSFYVFLGHWIWYGRGIQETVLILLSALILTISSLKHSNARLIRKPQLTNICVLVVLAIYCTVGILRANTRAYLAADLKAMVGTVIVSAAIVVSVRHLIKAGYDVLGFIFKYMNVYFIVNNLIIIVQYFIPYFLMNQSAITSVQNPFYFDQLTGFLGVNGTTRWDVWTIFLLSLNFYIARRKKSTKILWYNIALLFFSGIIAMINSARTFLILAPTVILIYFFVVQKSSLRQITKQLLGFSAALLVVVLIYLTNQEVHNYINYLFQDKLSVYLTFDLEHMVQTNDDRARALAYVLEVGGKFGIGIGAAPMHSSTSTAKYIGQNSTSIYIYLTGMFGYLLWTFGLTRLALTGITRNRTSKMVVYFLFLVFASYCLPIYSSAALLPAVMLMFFIFSLS